MLDNIISLFAPHECLSCREEGSLWCAECRQVLRPLRQHCYRCHKLSAGNRTCATCRRLSGLYAVQAATEYRAIAKELVGRLKFSGARAASNPAVELMRPLLVDGIDAVVPVPTASSRVRVRGYDQALLLARRLAAQSGTAYAPVIMRHGQSRQVGASRAQRRQQLQNVFKVTSSSMIQGKHLLLVDDVVTTGATLEAAAAALKAAGARRVSALVFARA